VARIRTIKPEFWEDEKVASLSLRARLLFIATWNMADDEGLLRWTPEYTKANAFIYEDCADELAEAMKELESARLVFPYKGGKLQQRLAYIVNFRKHQRINRPQPSRLPAPSVQSAAVKRMYAERDGWRCAVCRGEIPKQAGKDDRFNLSLDHVNPRSQGGNDYPSNIAVTHQSCNKSKKDRIPNPAERDEARRTIAEMRGSLNASVTDSLNESPQERKGTKEGNGKEGNHASLTETSTPTPRQKLDPDCPECGDRGWDCSRCARKLSELSDARR
jgi:5-methylcytosine-specific restriction endonuclease McrA